MRSAVLIGLGTAVVLMVVNFMVANKIGRYYAEYMVHKDDRMELLREFVSFPKQIKYLKWEHLWFDKINTVRRKEFAVTKANKWLDSLCVLFWSLTNTLISTATLWYFVSTTGEDNLEDQNIFTMIYLFSLLTGPLNALPWTITGMLQARTSFKRLDKYLLSAKSFNNFQEQLRTDNFGMYWD
jgi:ABC-type bacteriocin/lantibiotic exporter with double-glycine peptidase domain